MTTITDVRVIGVQVSDQDAALDFYVNTLGFVTRLDATISPTMRWIEVAAPDAAVSIALISDHPNPATDTGIRFTVPDAEREHEVLTSRGVEVGEILRWDGVPPMFTFDDPDGNRFEIVEAATR